MAQYIGSGEIKIGGCAGYRQTNYYTSEFAVGDVAFLRVKAHFGKLEKVAIKEVILQIDRYTSNQLLVKYKDTFNAIHIEGDLVDEITALLLVQDYYAYLEAVEKLHHCR